MSDHVSYATIKPHCAQVDGGNLPVGVLERRDFTLSITDEETLRRPPLPFWHVDYFTQPQLDDPDFFPAVPECPPPEPRGPPVDVLGPPEQPALELRPARLCPSPPPEKVDERHPDDASDGPPDMEAHLDWVSSTLTPRTSFTEDPPKRSEVSEEVELNDYEFP